jgi:hypothetical protein
MVGGSLEFLDPASGLQKDTYPTWTDADGLINPNANPISLDSQGAATVFLLDGESYDVILRDADDVQQWRIDDIETQAGQAASDVTVTDAGGYFVGTNVEACLQELGAATGAGIIGVADGGGYFAATDVEGVLQEIGATTGAGVVGILDTGGNFTATDVEGALSELASASAPSTYKVKTSSTIKNADATLADDPHLAGWTLTNSKHYAVTGYLRFSQEGANGDPEFQFDFSNAQTAGSFLVDALGISSGTYDVFNNAITTATTVATMGALEVYGVTITGSFTANGTTGGDVALQWAQAVSDANDTTLLVGSWLSFEQLD